MKNRHLKVRYKEDRKSCKFMSGGYTATLRKMPQAELGMTKTHENVSGLQREKHSESQQQMWVRVGYSHSFEATWSGGQ